MEKHLPIHEVEHWNYIMWSFL